MKRFSATKLAIIYMSLACILFLAPCAQALEQEPVPRSLRILSRPGADGGPTEVQTAIWLLDIDSIDSSAQSFVANIYVLLTWKDLRLARDGDGYETFNTTEVWTPKIQIANEIGLVRRTLPETVDVYPDGTVVYKQRYVGPFSQPLNLEDFPFDKHTFTLHFVSPNGSPDELKFVRNMKWVDGGLEKAAGIAKDISLPDWKIEGFDTREMAYTTSPSIAVSGYAFDFIASRDTRHYIWKVILPLLLIVIMSWGVFWIDPSNAGTQIGVATTSMLTLIAYRFAIDSQVPRVPYMTRIDQFIVVGTALVFLSLFQVITTSRLTQIGRGELARKIDRISRIAFPLAFIAALTLALIS